MGLSSQRKPEIGKKQTKENVGIEQERQSSGDNPDRGDRKSLHQSNSCLRVVRCDGFQNPMLFLLLVVAEVAEELNRGRF